MPPHVFWGLPVAFADALAMPSIRIPLVAHIAAGTLGIVTGFVALSAAKGGPAHRKSGLLFVYAMLLLGLTGVVIAVIEGAKTSVIAGLLTAYLALTAFAAVRPRSMRSKTLARNGMIFAFVIGAAALGFGFFGAAAGQTSPMLFIFGAVALCSAVADARLVRAGGFAGTARLTRHLWRMCLALFIATSSFFLGQANKFFPEPLRAPLLLAIPVLVPLIAMAYWLWRVRQTQVASRA